MKVVAAFWAVIILVSVVTSTHAEMQADSIVIVTGAASTGPELKAADILQRRIMKRSDIAVEVIREDAADVQSRVADADVAVILGAPDGNTLSAQLISLLDATLPILPNSDQRHPEGFAVKSGFDGGKNYVLIAGTDERGTLYGVGCLLRAMTFLDTSVVVPDLDVTEKPAFMLRGGRPTGPGSRARLYGDLRPQTSEEIEEVMEDLMLLGTNVFEGKPDYVRSYGMMTVFGRTANEMPAGFPEAWRADDGRSPKYVCPSIPEARQALLNSFDEMFRQADDYDFFTTNSGDVGGCRCDRCEPWGATYIKLMHEIADILHKYHPDTKILATNQDLTNEGNLAIFDYLNAAESSWLYAIRYGPGADEMQPYIRGPVNPRWFEFEGFGALGNYLKYMHHELPRTTNIVLYSDITHWMQAQFAVESPDLALAAVYDRRSWNARPRHFHKVAREIFHYALGDMHYSEGMHDDFNKWFWYRMMWNPALEADAITLEYCRYWLGPEAADEAARAIFLMEETLEKPVLGNAGIAQAVDLLRAAGAKIPANLLEHDYRWRIMLQKALMDRYIQLSLERGQAMKESAATILAGVADSATPVADAQKALEPLEAPLETEEMRTVMAEALKAGEESNQTIGYREPAPFLIEKLDLTEIGWWRKTLQTAIATQDDAKVRNAARMILHYDDPGEGGFYEDVGWPNQPKHLTHGEWLWGLMPFPGPAKHSQYNLAYTMNPDRGVSFSFDGLDPSADYVVRLSVGAHIDDEAPALRGMKLAQGIEADGEVVSEEFPVPVDDVALEEFDIPRAATADGTVEIALVPKSDQLPITGLLEIWLMRKDKMPWTARL